MKKNPTSRRMSIICFAWLVHGGESFHAHPLPFGSLHHRLHNHETTSISCLENRHKLRSSCVSRRGHSHPLRLSSAMRLQRRPHNRKNNRQRENPPSLSQAIERNKEIISLGKQRRLDDLFELFENERRDFSHVNFATMIMQIQRMGPRGGVRQDDPRLKALLLEIGKQLQNPSTASRWRSREICNVVYAMSKIIKFRDMAEARIILDYLESDKVLADILKTGTSQEIANLLWAYAKQGYDSQVVFGAAERQISRFLKTGTTQEIANVLWAYAKLGYASSVVFRAAEEYIDRLVDDGTPQGIANVLWAYATQGYVSEAGFGTAERHIDRVFENGTSQNIANVLWAYAKQGYDSPEVFEAAERHVDRIFENGTPQNIANILWAYAKLGYDSKVLFEAAERHVGLLFEDANPQVVANILWAYATMRYDSPVLFQAAERRIDSLLAGGNPQDIANILWAYATMGYDSPVVFRTAERHIDHLLRGWTSQGIANVLWAYATQGYMEETSIANLSLVLWNKATQMEWSDLTEEAKVQLLGASVMASAACPMKVPKEWLDDARLLGKENRESKLQEGISVVLSNLGFEHRLEVDAVPNLIPGYLAIDIACPEIRIAIEVDGPSHFLRKLRLDRGTLPAENGSTKAKRRLLARLGWKVINIPYFEWNRHESEQEKKEYLSRLLARAGFTGNKLETSTNDGENSNTNPATRDRQHDLLDAPDDLEAHVVRKMLTINGEWKKATVANMKAYLTNFNVKGMSGAKKSQLVDFIVNKMPPAETIKVVAIANQYLFYVVVINSGV